MGDRAPASDRIRAMLLDGVPYSKIVADVGCSKGTISYHAARLGMGSHQTRYDWKAISEYIEEGHSKIEAAARFGFSARAWSCAELRGVVPSTRLVEHSQLPRPAIHTDTPGHQGTRSEAIVLAALVRVYRTVLVPFGGVHRFDFVIETNVGFQRIQCKTGRLRNGVIEFSTVSTRRNGQGENIRRNYIGDVDFFAVYCSELDSCYLVPIGRCPGTHGSLRVDPVRNSQQRGIVFAADYELGSSAKAPDSPPLS